jgi:hypothetical protein
MMPPNITNGEQLFSEPWFTFLLKCHKSLIGWRLLLPELDTNASETRCRSNNPTQNNLKDLSPLRLVAMRILPEIAQDTG